MMYVFSIINTKSVVALSNGINYNVQNKSKQ